MLLYNLVYNHHEDFKYLVPSINFKCLSVVPVESFIVTFVFIPVEHFIVTFVIEVDNLLLVEC